MINEIERLFILTIQEEKYEKKKSKVGRNEHCPCGSGKKYKKCCGKIA